MKPPTKLQLINALDKTDQKLAEMVGRWGNGISSEHRAELLKMWEPLVELLIDAGRRGQTREPIRRSRRTKDILPPD